MTGSLAEVHPNELTLRNIYADLTQLDGYPADDIVLHTADRDIIGRPVIGKEAVLRKERELIHLSGDSHVMDVQLIAANDSFGVALGTLRARLNVRGISVPFCGLWRFRDGCITEHWENAYDPLVLRRLLASDLLGCHGRNGTTVVQSPS